MAYDNAISVEFTKEELDMVNGHLSAIEELLRSKCKSLTPEERQEFARLGNKTENWSKKTMSYIHEQPSLTPSFINLVETEKDFASRQSLMPVYNRVSGISDLLNDTLMLLGADVYNSCVAYYRNVRLLAEQNVNGAKTVYDDLSAQFPGRRAAAKESSQQATLVK